jgi:uncharacterized membrane protein (DUF485 family)
MYIINTMLDLFFNHLGEILGFLATGSTVAVVLQIIKHYGKLQEAKKVVMLLLAVLSFFAAYAGQFLSFTSGNAAILALHNLGWVVTIAVFVHRFAVSPVYYGLINVVKAYNQNLTDAEAYRAQVAAQTAQIEQPLPSQEFKIPQ